MIWAVPFSLAATKGILRSKIPNIEISISEKLLRDSFLFLNLLRCFTSVGLPSHITVGLIEFCSNEFPHSEIAGSKVASHLPDAYRRHATSFIAASSQGIHHMLLCPAEIYNFFNYLH